jgi:hypothetical protein
MKFADLGFSEVRAQNLVFSSPYSRTSANGDSPKFVHSMFVIFGSEELRGALPHMYATYTQNPAAG